MVENGEPDNKQMKSKMCAKRTWKENKGAENQKSGRKKEGVKQNERIESKEKKRAVKKKNKQ